MFVFENNAYIDNLPQLIPTSGKSFKRSAVGGRCQQERVIAVLSNSYYYVRGYVTALTAACRHEDIVFYTCLMYYNVFGTNLDRLRLYMVLNLTIIQKEVIW